MERLQRDSLATIDRLALDEVASRRGLASRATLELTAALRQKVRLSLGTPPQEFWPSIDTGTANFWVASTACTASACANYTKFDGSKSSTFSLNQTQPFYTVYGEGTQVRGTAATDVLRLDNHTFPSFSFAVVSDANFTGPTPTDSDGYIGMGFRPGNGTNAAVTSLKHVTLDSLENGGITKFALSPATPSSSGNLALETVDTQATAEHDDFTYVNLTAHDTENGEWLANSTFIGLSGSITETFPQPLSLFLDTGSVLSMLPYPVVQKLAMQLSLTAIPVGANQAVGGTSTIYNVSCDRIPTLPSITFDLNGANLTVPPTSYVIQVTPSACYFGFEGVSGGPTCSTDASFDACFVGILAQNVLRNYYTTWDFVERVVGFAQLTGNATSGGNAAPVNSGIATDPSASGSASAATGTHGNLSPLVLILALTMAVVAL
ncbi:hypothetical protein HKX48_009274 [Thoreauomyces humboldtii]|nr:hypothetical protein HKX48_009274 [Thoreauomyces humboldtii]